MQATVTGSLSKEDFVNGMRHLIDTLPEGSMFYVEFLKKDQTVRKMTCFRKSPDDAVIKHPANNTNPAHILVYDVAADGYRTVNLETIVILVAKDIRFEDPRYAVQKKTMLALF